MRMDPSVKSILRAIRTEIEVTRARKLSAQGKIRDAREKLREVYKSVGQPPPSSDVEPYLNILYGSISSQMGNDRDAFLACEMAVEQIRSGEMRRKYRPQDLKYLLYCCRAILAKATNYSDSLAFSLAKSIDVKYDDLEIDKVSMKIRNTFDIPPELGREYDEYIAENT